MTRIRWSAAVAALVLVLLGGLGSGARGAATSHRVLAVSPGSPSKAVSDVLSARPEAPGPALVAVEAGRAPALARSQDSAGMRWLAAALVAVALLAAAARRRRPQLRLLLELTVRCQTEWWRPTPGGRAPPRLTFS